MVVAIKNFRGGYKIPEITKTELLVTIVYKDFDLFHIRCSMRLRSTSEFSEIGNGTVRI